jgi:hypothetical protein
MCTCKYTVASTHPAMHTYAYLHGRSCSYMHLHIDMRRCGPEALPRVSRKGDVFPDELSRRPAVCTKSVPIQPQRHTYEWRREAGGCATRTHAQQRTRRTRPASWQRRPVRRVGAASVGARACDGDVLGVHVVDGLEHVPCEGRTRAHVRAAWARSDNNPKRDEATAPGCQLAGARRGKRSAALRALVLRYSGYSREGRSAYAPCVFPRVWSCRML